jgi:hypothetical protein
VGEKGERDNAARGVACGVESAAAAWAAIAIAAAQDELERMPVANSLLVAFVCKLGMDVCESELPGEVDIDDTGWATVKCCDDNGTGIDAIWLGEVRKCLREADRENLSGKGRVFRSISMLAFP